MPVACQGRRLPDLWQLHRIGVSDTSARRLSCRPLLGQPPVDSSRLGSDGSRTVPYVCQRVHLYLADGLLAYVCRTRAADSRKWFLQAQHLDNGRRPLCEKRFAPRLRIHNLLYGRQCWCDDRSALVRIREQWREPRGIQVELPVGSGGNASSKTAICIRPKASRWE